MPQILATVVQFTKSFQFRLHFALDNRINLCDNREGREKFRSTKGRNEMKKRTDTMKNKSGAKAKKTPDIKKEKAPKPGAAERKARAKKAWTLVLNILCVLSGVFVLGVYIPYFVWHVTHLHAADSIVSLIVFAAVLLPFFLRKPLRKLLKKVYTPLKIVWCIGMCFYMVTFTAFAGFAYLHKDVVPQESDKQQVVVVFGCQVRADGALSSHLSSRVRKAVEVLNEAPDAICIVSGGQGDDEPYSEAAAMQKALVRRGVDPGRIYLEDKSTSTVENLRFSLDKLEELGYKADDCSLIFVSSRFHTPRIFMLANRFGVKDCGTASADRVWWVDEYISTVREYMSLVHLVLLGS